MRPSWNSSNVLVGPTTPAGSRSLRRILDGSGSIATSARDLGLSVPNDVVTIAWTVRSPSRSTQICWVTVSDSISDSTSTGCRVSNNGRTYSTDIA